MSSQTMKIVSTLIVTMIIATTSLAQKTFRVAPIFLDTLDFKGYKAFIVSKDFEVKFIGRTIPYSERFTPDTSEAKAANNAIQSQYASAELHQLDKQYNSISAYSDTTEWKKDLDTYKKR